MKSNIEQSQKQSDEQDIKKQIADDNSNNDEKKAYVDAVACNTNELEAEGSKKIAANKAPANKELLQVLHWNFH